MSEEALSEKAQATLSVCKWGEAKSLQLQPQELSWLLEQYPSQAAHCGKSDYLPDRFPFNRQSVPVCFTLASAHFHHMLSPVLGKWL